MSFISISLLVIVAFAEMPAAEAGGQRFRQGRLRALLNRPRMNCRHAIDSSRPSVASLTKLVEMRQERLAPGDKWVPLAKGEISWDEDVIRFSPVLHPDVSNRVVTVRLIKRPWDDDKQPWTIVSESKPGELYTRGDLGPGDWAVSMEVVFDDHSILRWHDQ